VPELFVLDPVVLYRRRNFSSSEERRVELTHQSSSRTRELESEINSIGSARSESFRPRRELRNLMQKYDAQVADISLYLAIVERQARTAEIEESEWVSQPTHGTVAARLRANYYKGSRGENEGLPSLK
ncbi:hypothetical protein AVEN_172574-1, partial [Araneus ventricosus]